MLRYSIELCLTYEAPTVSVESSFSISTVAKSLAIINIYVKDPSSNCPIAVG